MALQMVVEAGSFWAAADRLETPQSALSQQIAALEHVVGARLIERLRGRSSIVRTEPGEIFLQSAMGRGGSRQVAYSPLDILVCFATIPLTPRLLRSEFDVAQAVVGALTLTCLCLGFYTRLVWAKVQPIGGG